jgi:hypothetical protein
MMSVDVDSAIAAVVELVVPVVDFEVDNLEEFG